MKGRGEHCSYVIGSIPHDQDSGMESFKGYYNSFVVKIWSDEVEGTMRGYVQHVRTQDYAYFLSLENMTDFIVRHLSRPSSDYVVQDNLDGKT